MRRWWTVPAATALGLGLAGCSLTGSSSVVTPSTAAAGTTTAPAPSGSGSTTVGPTAAAPAPSPSASTGSGGGAAAACTPSQLSVSAGGTGAGAGQRYLTLVFRNVSATACTLHGYPGVDGLDAQGRRVTSARREPAATIATVLLGAGRSGSVTVHAGVVPTGSATLCPADYASLLVTPPNLTTSTRVTTSVPSCDGLGVSPVVSGVVPQ